MFFASFDGKHTHDGHAKPEWVEFILRGRNTEQVLIEIFNSKVRCFCLLLLPLMDKCSCES